MTSSNILSHKEIKSFGKVEYSYCDVCAYNGHPNEKVVFQFNRLRSEEEEGFIYDFTAYDYPKQAGKIHFHKSDKVPTIIPVTIECCLPHSYPVFSPNTWICIFRKRGEV